MARKSAKRESPELDMFDLMLQNDEDAQVKLDYLVDTPDKAITLLARLENVPAMSFDTEGTGLEPGYEDLTVPIDQALARFSNDLFTGFSIAISSTEAWYIPTRHYQARCLSEPWVRRILDLVVRCKRVYVHHSYHDMKVMVGYYHGEVYNQMSTVDTLVGTHTLFQGEDVGGDKKKRNVLGLKKLARQLFNRNPGDFDDQWLGTKILRAPMDQLAYYAREDAINTFILGQWLDRESEAQGTAKYLREVGYPLIPVLGRARYYGISVDRDKLKSYKVQAEEKMSEMVQELRQRAGKDINPNSGRDMDAFIYDVLEMPQVGERGEDGNRPLAAEDLKDVVTAARLLTEEGIRGYDDETIKFVDQFLEYQSLSKIYGSFIVALLDKSALDGRIYPDLKQTGTVSGRFASANPNGQNLPTGKKCKIAGLNLDIRAVFMPDPGCVFVTLDESALEVRVLAHFCGEPALIEALHLPKNQGGDPHQAAADKVYAETAIKIARDAAKTIQFGLIYGMSEHGLSLKLGISKKKALELIAAYYRGLPAVAVWKQTLEHQIRRTGEVRSLLGRIRKTELHRSNNKQLIEAVIRSMTNTQIQGSAADIINSAMVKTHNNERYQRAGARICLQVHDELVSNCPRATAEEALQIKSFYMRNPFDFQLKVPLVVEGGISDRWEH